MRFLVDHNVQRLEMAAESAGDTVGLDLPSGKRIEYSAREVETGLLEVVSGDRRFRAAYVQDKEGIRVSYGGRVYMFRSAALETARSDTKDHSGELLAPMTGAIADVLVKVGDSVSAYQPLVIVEAMKVLATVEAPFAGSVTRVGVAKGERVEHGALLMELARTDGNGD